MTPRRFFVGLPEFAPTGNQGTRVPQGPQSTTYNTMHTQVKTPTKHHQLKTIDQIKSLLQALNAVYCLEYLILVLHKLLFHQGDTLDGNLE